MSTETKAGSSPAVPRMLAGVLVALLAVVAVPVWFLVGNPAPSVDPSSVEVRDEAGVLDAEALAREVGEVDFWRPVDVAVLTLGDLGGLGMNDAVLQYARSQPGQPWISSTRTDKWADGLFIIAVAPTERLVGTYFGEDVKLDLEAQASVQEATKDQFRAADWPGGLLSGVRSAAGQMGRPTIANIGTPLVLVAGLVGVFWLGVVALRGRKSRRNWARAQEAYASVTRDFDATRVSAGTIPGDDPHGAEVLRRLAVFTAEYHAMLRGFLDFGTPSALSMFTTQVRDEAGRLAESAERLDATDDSIVHAAEFLNMTSRWRDAWMNEQGPVLEDLGALEKLASDHAKDLSAQDQHGVAETVSRIRGRLDQMTAALDGGTLAPRAALDELDLMAQGIRQWADRLVGVLLDAGDPAEARERRSHWNDTDWTDHSGYSGEWSVGGRSGTYGAGSTIRTQPGMPGYQGGFDSRSVPVAGLVVGYSLAASAAAPDTDSSSGGGSSYSGGFSGSGSSSSF